MSQRTTSLRQRHRPAALAAGLALAAVIQPGSALAAGGSPLPAPDAPPSGQALRPAQATVDATQTKAAPATPSPKTTPTTTRPATVTPTPDTPTPDPPLAAAPTQTVSKPEPKPASGPETKTTAAPRGEVTTAPASPATYAQPTRTTRAAPPAAKPKPKPKPKPRKAPVAAVRTPSPPPVTRPPHDTLRLGLPIAVLPTLEDEASTQLALLLAAAVLLGASGAGGLVVGLSARRLARGA